MLIIYRFSLLLCFVAALVSLGGCFSAPNYRGPESDHFNGTKFFNEISAKKKFSEYRQVSKEFFKNRKQWPANVPVKQRTSLEFVDDEFSVTFIGHATVLIRVDGLNILTDPIFSRMASPVEWDGPSRRRLPGIALDHLPHIDLILISHNHYDHLDEKSVRGIVAKQNQNPPVILAPLGNGLLFKKWGIDSAYDLDWGDDFEFSNINIELHEARHRSGRWLTDQMKTLWGAFVINSSRGNIYFGGDSGYGPHFKNTSLRSGPMRLSLLPIGAYEPRWFMEAIHLDPDQAVTAHQDLNSELSIGIHFGTFQLTTEGIDDPIFKLIEARQKHNVSDDDFVTLDFGETLQLE